MVKPMEIKPQFTFDQVRHDQETNLHLVLSLTAPKSDWQAKRPPLCVIPVLDISGSMSGPKLDYAKQSILKLIEHLSADDYLGIVSFSSNARVDAAPRKMTPEVKDELRALVNRFRTEGSTNFSGGMLLGLKIANELDLPETTIVRVITFTDGQPTHGVTDPKGLCDLLDKQAGRASVSAFGYGQDANQSLLSDLATKGKGNYAFVREPDAALAAFGKELGGLLSTYAQDIRIELSPHNGHQIKEVLTDADVEEETTGEIEIKLPHLLSEETAHVVLAVKLSEQKQPGPRQVNAIDVKFRYQVIDQDGKLTEKTGETKAKIQFVKPGEEQKTATKAIDEIVARAQLIKAQIEAEKHAQAGNFGAAAAAFSAFQQDANVRGLVGVAAVADHVGNYYQPERYAASAGNRVGLRRAMSRGTGTSGMAREDEAVLLSANYQVSNEAQAHTALHFAGSPAPAPTPADPAPVPAVDLGSLLGSLGTGDLSVTGDLGAVSGGLSVGASLGGGSILMAPPTPPPTQVDSNPPAKSTVSKTRSNRW